MPCDNMLGGGTHDLSFFSSCVVAKSIVRDDMRDRGGDSAICTGVRQRRNPGAHYGILTKMVKLKDLK